jgi:hypothetical protein
MYRCRAAVMACRTRRSRMPVLAKCSTSRLPRVEKDPPVAYSPSAHSEARKLVEDTLSKSLNIDLNNRDLRPENLIVF